MEFWKATGQETIRAGRLLRHGAAAWTFSRSITRAKEFLSNTASAGSSPGSPPQVCVYAGVVTLGLTALLGYS